MSKSDLWRRKPTFLALTNEYLRGPVADARAERSVIDIAGQHQPNASGADDERQETGRAFLARFVVLNLVGAALVAAAWLEGYALKPYEADASRISLLITALFFWGLWRTLRRDWQAVRWVGNTLVYLGMVGTVLGLIVTVGELTVDGVQNFDNFKAIISAIFIGSGTALYTNLLACIGYLWLGANAQLLARQEI